MRWASRCCAALALLLARLGAERPQERGTNALRPPSPPGPPAQAHDAFEYADLTSRIGQLKKDAAAYEDQVKGPVVDHADTWLQQKSRYQDFLKELDHGMNVQMQLVHKLRTEERKKATEQMKEAEAETNSTEAQNSTETKNSTESGPAQGPSEAASPK